MTLDELSVSFTADISGFAAAVAQVSALITAAAGEADGLAAHFAAAGAAAGDGLRSGILSRRGAVVSAAQAVARAAANALRGTLDIHSPSRVTYQVGAFFDQGLLDGMAASASQVEKEASLLGQTAASALSAPDVATPGATWSGFAASSPTPEQTPLNLSITVPLEIDGYRLGVAAIEGINRVTNGTGRVELAL
ncbi:MAG: hypothetical protein IJ189_05965 [Clostridia bacterium]|nr:hypothetical protein [Clostridia bacterium]